MATRLKITRKGQVTIPVEFRRELGLDVGQYIVAERTEDGVLLRQPTSAVEQTAGMLRKYRLAEPLSVEQEREAFERGVAEEVSGLASK